VVETRGFAGYLRNPGSAEMVSSKSIKNEALLGRKLKIGPIFKSFRYLASKVNLRTHPGDGFCSSARVTIGKPAQESGLLQEFRFPSGTALPLNLVGRISGKCERRNKRWCKN
jgi:hypothetical protein